MANLKHKDSKAGNTSPGTKVKDSITQKIEANTHPVGTLQCMDTLSPNPQRNSARRVALTFFGIAIIAVIAVGVLSYIENTAVSPLPIFGRNCDSSTPCPAEYWCDLPDVRYIRAPDANDPLQKGTCKPCNQNTAWRDECRDENLSLPIPDTTNASVIIETRIGEQFQLKQNQTAHILDEQAPENTITLTVTGFTYSPCLEGTHCFWSGLEVAYTISLDSHSYPQKFHDIGYREITGTPYVVYIKQSDYQSYAEFKVTRQDSGEK